ncbi:adenosylmethionine--8-amino-7-oxononanoate transaminase [Leptospira sp. 96542]|nr:adenosylmethionine--8-amino-7-oxononanoate transaminase [Leptospira sp. 96542]
METNPLKTHTWVPLTLQSESETILQVLRAENEYLIDENGEYWLDAISSWWTKIFGHRHPKLMSALKEQMEVLDHVMLAGNIHEPAENLSKKILELTDFDFKKVFYSDNGSNAVEIALKLVLQYHKNSPDPNDTKRSKFLVFTDSYHGDSIGAMNVSGQNYFNRVFGELRFPTDELKAPNCLVCPWGKKVDTCSVECLEKAEESFSKENYAGVVIEPLLFGANGMVFYEPKFLSRLRELTMKYSTLLIFDEVFTGMGRLGNYFAYQKANVKPDLIAMAKGLTGGVLPLAATLVSEKVYERFITDDPYKSFFHAHTMTGNPLACSVGLAAISILESEGLEFVKKLELKLKLRSKALENKLGNKIQNPRVMGGVFAFEWNEQIAEDEYLNPVGKRIKKELAKHRVLVRPLGRTIYITPPYTISDLALDKIFFALESLEHL